MKKFTVKDFIAYNNPCFSCDSPINFRLGYFDLDTQATASYLRPVVTPNYTEIDLLITYNDSLRLNIFHKTNKILTNSNQALTKYLDSRKLFLSSTCSKCYTQIESQFLDINVDKGYIGAVGISTERLMVADDKNRYQVDSYFMDEKTSLAVTKMDSVKPLSPLTLDLPLMPKYRFKNKEHFISKMKTYIIFS
jgi:hypothetical protein